MSGNIDKTRQRGCSLLVALYALAALGIAMLLCGCTRTVYEPVETVRTEKDVVTRWLTDTVVQNDTHFIFVKGDTVIDWRDRWRECIKEVHDTVYVERTDSVPVPYPVERKLTKWEQTKMDFGGFAIGAIIAVVCIAVIWLIKKFRK